MRHATLATVALLLSPAASLRAGELPTIPAPVKRNIEYRIESGVAPGIAVGLINQHGMMTYGFGTTTPGGDQKIDGDTVFEIGSITKVFTATLLTDAARRGLLAVDDPVQKHLPADVHMPLGKDRPITLRDLATHRSGLPRLPDNMSPKDPTNPYADYGSDKLHFFLSAHALPLPAGEKYEYSNLGAGLLGHVLTLVQKKSYEQLIIERIAVPLDMKSTALTLTPDMRTHLAPGHNNGKQVANWDFDSLAGCGSVRSTAGDMLRFLGANMGLIETDLLPAMGDTVAELHDIGSKHVRIALGWHTLGEGDDLIIWHNGQTGGYGSFCGFVPATKQGLVILANASVRLDDLGRHLLDPDFPLEYVRPQVKVPIKTLDRYTGRYQLETDRVMHISRVGKTLFAHVTGRPSVELHAETKTRFAYDVIDAQIEFVVAGDAPANALVMTMRETTRRAPRIRNSEKEVVVEPRILRSYVGRYEVQSGVGFAVSLQGEHLMIQPDGQTSSRLHAASATEFSYAGGSVKITFEKGTPGIPAHLVVEQGDKEVLARKIR